MDWIFDTRNENCLKSILIPWYLLEEWKKTINIHPDIITVSLERYVKKKIYNNLTLDIFVFLVLGPERIAAWLFCSSISAVCFETL